MTDDDALTSESKIALDVATYHGLAPGWYRNPSEPDLVRYWDGTELSEEKRNVAIGSAPPPPPPASALPPPPPGTLARQTSGAQQATNAPTWPPAQDDLAVIVEAREAARAVPVLGMRCDKKEVPEPLAGPEPSGWWVALSTFRGQARAGGETKQLGDLVSITAQGVVALAVAGRRLLGIVSPDTSTAPAIWFASSISALRIESSGSQGVFKKRPTDIRLSTREWTLELAQVNRIFRPSNMIQYGQEGSLLTAMAALTPPIPNVSSGSTSWAAGQGAEDGGGRLYEHLSSNPPPPPTSQAQNPLPAPAGSNTPVETLTWERNSELGGLYVLHVDGTPLAATALVDRNLSRGEQAEALAELDWPPPQQMIALYEATIQSKLSPPSHMILPGGRHTSPFLGGFAAVMDGDEGENQHPVRRYLYPHVTREGQVALEPGERLLLVWRSSKPKILTRKKADGKLITSPTAAPSQLRNMWGILTTQRLVFQGHLNILVSAQGDYSLKLGLASPALDELRATFRQIKRWSECPNLFWAFHIRHEWVCEVGHGYVPDRKKPLLTKEEKTNFVSAAFLYPSGNSGLIHVPHKEDEPSSQQVALQYLAAVQSSQNGVVVSDPSVRTRPVASLGFGSHKNTEETTFWTVQGTTPLSLPERF